MDSKKRGPNKVQNCYGMKDMYLDYIKDKTYSDPYYITFEEYQDICGDYYKEVCNAVILESKFIKLPFRMGHLYVGKKKPKVLSSATLSTDWQESRRLHKRILNINDHTGGFKFRFIWTKNQSFIVNKELYRLVFSRTNKRDLAKAIKSGSHDYIEIK